MKAETAQGTFLYTYDPLNRRISKNNTNYLWDDKNEIGTTTGELRILGEGLGAEIGSACFIVLNKQTYIPIHDHRGALVSLIDLKSKPVETYRYSAFGEELTSGHLSPWRFLSKRIDEETNFAYFGRRYYSPSLGRWITPDPIGFEDGPNLYSYVQNSPLLAIDLYGEWAFWQNLGQWSRNAFNFAFPACAGLARLPSNAPLWQRATLSGLAVFEVGTLLMPAAKVGLTLAEKSIYQISTSAMARETARKGANYSAQKTATLAAEKRIAQKSAQGVSREGAYLSRGAESVNAGIRLNTKLSAQEIAGGHAFKKHASEFGFKTSDQMASHIEKVMGNPTMTRLLSNGRTAYWDKTSSSIVIRHPKSIDGGTTFIPKNGINYFLNELY